MKKSYISPNVIRRLPRYLRTLNELQNKRVTRISSTALGKILGFTASQIRQDLSCFGEFGKQGYGYVVSDLKREIENILGMNRNLTAILVGCGNIGKALIQNFSFKENGVSLKCAFDQSPELVGSSINGVEVFDASELGEYLKENSPDIVVLAVPKDIAVGTAKFLINNGVRAIWNFTNVDVVEPFSPVLVENIHFSDSLLALGYYLSTENEDTKAEIA